MSGLTTKQLDDSDLNHTAIVQCLTAIIFPGTSIKANGGAFDQEDYTEYPDSLVASKRTLQG
ncbi:hypothetical protein [Nostoc sp. CMAA1605]|uniref:hypothetical protein n=1 Tax=Nostoc sp. CMAA1605 TaxID=2055159 RepID=UPI001F1C7AC7|nr:hypothetical protein [Nostoc sp. CMAA1605]